MRKKYLSALLFGAILVTSTGTFTSCKDYDDEIAGLQEQVDAVKASVADLEKKIDAGNWVTAVNSVEGGFEITFNDGQKYTIVNGKDGINGADGAAGQDGKSPVITIDPETNNWIIDGVDTGVCAKGEKGDKGDQGEQGPAGEQGPQGEQGVQGVAGKAPSIDPETKNWIVYEYNEETGAWDSKDTGICAEGTRSYVVDDGGDYYVLNMPNENGEFVQINLPKSPDTFTIEALTETVTVISKTAEWAPKSSSPVYLSLVEKFPEIKDIPEGQLVKQQSLLPVMVTPSEVTLTEGMKFALYNVEGEVVANLSNPVKGLPDNLNWDNEELVSGTRGTSDDCFWTLEMTPVLEDGVFVGNGNPNEKYSLAIVKSNGSVNKTPFSYKINHNNNGSGVNDVDIQTNPNVFNVKTSEDGIATIDLMKDVFTLTDGFDKYYFCELEEVDKATAEEYGISLENNILTVKFPAGKEYINILSDKIKIRCTALGLNGSAKSTSINGIYIDRTVQSTGDIQFSDKLNVELSSDKTSTGVYANNIRWNVEELGFSALELQNFITVGYVPRIELYQQYNNEWNLQRNYIVKFYKADGSETTDYNEAVTYGITLNSRDLLPSENYKFVLIKRDQNQAVTYKKEAKFTVVNPKFTIAPQSGQGENGALIAVEDVLTNIYNGYIYTPLDDIKAGFTFPEYATVNASSYEDADHTLWSESYNPSDHMFWGATNFIIGNNLRVPTYQYGENIPADNQAIGKVRKIKVEYYLFDNPQNKQTAELEVLVKSPVYSENPSNVITADVASLSVKKGENLQIARYLSAKYAFGSYKYDVAAASEKATDKYNLFTYSYQTSEKNEADPVLFNDGTEKYVQGVNGQPVQISSDDYISFGFKLDDISSIGNRVIYLSAKDQVVDLNGTKVTLDGWNTIYAKRANDTKTLYNKYKSLVAFKTNSVKDHNFVISNVLTSTELKFVKPNDAKKYVSGFNETTGIISAADGTISVKSDISEDATLDVKLTVTDKWGMMMEYEFPVQIKK